MWLVRDGYPLGIALRRKVDFVGKRQEREPDRTD